MVSIGEEHKPGFSEWYFADVLPFVRVEVPET